MPAISSVAARAHVEPKPRAARFADGEPIIDLAFEAERFAILYPRRARLIRRLRGLPADCRFGPPEPEVVHAIVTGTSPALLELDNPDATEATG